MSTVPIASPGPRRAPRPLGTPAPASRPPLRVVPPRAIRPARTPFVLLVTGLLSLGLIALLLLNTALAEGSFTLSALQRDQAVLAGRAQALEQDLARLQAPQRLADQARALGMVPAGNPVFLTTPDGKILGEPKPGVAAPKPAKPAAKRPAATKPPTEPAAGQPKPGQPATGEAGR
jgi:hypothetical protein